MIVPLLDLKAQYNSIKTDIDSAVAEVFESQYFINGPQVKQCEKAISNYCNTSDAVGVSSGTDALLIALMVEGIGAGDEVITTDFSFFATAGSVARTGAKPVFVDIDPISYNIDPDQIRSKITSDTKAIIPVHLYGQVADMDPIMEIAEEYNLTVIEDGAQAIGAEYKGRRAGSIGHYGCFSFFPSKNLGTSGDGGIVVTNDPKRSEMLMIFRNHGSKPKYYHKFIGGNFRLDTLHAAVVLAKLPHLDSWSDVRKHNADRYRQLIEEKGLIDNGVISLPVEVANRHIYNQFVIRAEKRNDLQAYLKEKKIGTEVYYPVPFHSQECFAYLNQKDEFPESEAAANETLALPIYPELSDDQAIFVVNSIVGFYSDQRYI
ncbi:MAG: DegT/DnrJ/EryC1/StrS family aminotransferase [Candidatus Electryonea clarkiae]|nr:DegT/DnrJ/EryC1/StrS family aminotransferase [Candidatus Electryonea clarkiae]MDP8285851.1 DegT/DnrJ/EryC1/StrS family aminotransferase [Candidatus Electryonea clarkiae]